MKAPLGLSVAEAKFRGHQCHSDAAAQMRIARATVEAGQSNYSVCGETRIHCANNKCKYDATQVLSSGCSVEDQAMPRRTPSLPETQILNACRRNAIL